MSHDNCCVFLLFFCSKSIAAFIHRQGALTSSYVSQGLLCITLSPEVACCIDDVVAIKSECNVGMRGTMIALLRELLTEQKYDAGKRERRRRGCVME